jgi:hypothetical protein
MKLKMQPLLHFRKKLATEIKYVSGFFENVLWVAFLNPSGSSLVDQPGMTNMSKNIHIWLLYINELENLNETEILKSCKNVELILE